MKIREEAAVKRRYDKRILAEKLEVIRKRKEDAAVRKRKAGATKPYDSATDGEALRKKIYERNIHRGMRTINPSKIVKPTAQAAQPVKTRTINSIILGASQRDRLRKQHKTVDDIVKEQQAAIFSKTKPIKKIPWVTDNRDIDLLRSHNFSKRNNKLHPKSKENWGKYMNRVREKATYDMKEVENKIKRRRSLTDEQIRGLRNNPYKTMQMFNR